MIPNDLVQRAVKFFQETKKEGTIFPSAVRTTTQTSDDIVAYAGVGVVVNLDVTNVNTSSLVLKIQRKDPASGKYIDVLTSAAVTSISTNTYKVYPGLTAATNLTVNDVITGIFRVVVTHGNANNTTYSVGYSIV